MGGKCRLRSDLKKRIILYKGKSGYYYQIDSVVVDESVDHDEYLEIWRESHPDRVVRIVIRSDYDEVAGYLIVHHQRA